MSHRNARLTVHGRRLIIQRHPAGWPPAHIAAAMGVSRQCVYKWIRRYQAQGQAGLEDRSSRPHSMPAKTAPATETAVLAARTGVPARTVSRILARHRVPHLDRCDRLTGQPIRATRTTAVRYERARPGELVHLDVKKLGRIPDRGRLARPRAQRTGPGPRHRLRLRALDGR